MRHGAEQAGGFTTSATRVCGGASQADLAPTLQLMAAHAVFDPEAAMKPLYEFGQQVRVVRNVRNDGTFPGRDVGELLLRRGATGYVRDIGTFLQDELIYSVDFIDYGYRVGCREPELVDADLPWVPNRYEFRDKVTLRYALAVQGCLVAPAGVEVEILKVERELAQGIHYQIHVNERTFLVPEDYLMGPSDFDERVQRSIAKGVDTSASVSGATLPWQSL
jgi:nitrogen fixation protein NifZ